MYTAAAKVRCSCTDVRCVQYSTNTLHRLRALEACLLSNHLPLDVRGPSVRPLLLLAQHTTTYCCCCSSEHRGRVPTPMNGTNARMERSTFSVTVPLPTSRSRLEGVEAACLADRALDLALCFLPDVGACVARHGRRVRPVCGN